MIRVGVCMPHGGLVHPAVYRNMFQLQDAMKATHEFMYFEMELASVQKARNMMVQACLEQGMDLLHFVDDDVVLPPNVARLYEQSAPIIAGYYISRQSPHTPQMYMRSPDVETSDKYVPVMDYEPDSVLEVDAVGGGCLLVQAEVFRRLQKRWNDLKTDALYAMTDTPVPATDFWIDKAMKLSPWFEFLDALGEDFYFCERAKEAGYRIFVDTSVKCTHLSTIGLTEAHFIDAKTRGLIQFDSKYKVEAKQSEDPVPAAS